MKRTHFEEFVSSLLNTGFAYGGLETKTISELLPEKQCEFDWEKLLEEIQVKAQEEGKYFLKTIRSFKISKKKEID